jgi:RNA polymerase sigma-70 factor (ECF subfamily)
VEEDRAQRTTPDAALVARIRDGDQAALAEVYRRHAGSVYALAVRILRDQFQAEEIVQEVFLRLWERPERFDEVRGSCRAYLLMEAQARTVDRIRAEERRRDREQRAQRDAVESYELDVELRDLVIGEQVREALAELSADEREAIELAYFGGRTYKQVALVLHQPEGTIKSRIRAGLTRLRHRLLDHGIDESWIPN